MRLRRDFYIRGTLKVAKDLLGKFIVRKNSGKERAGMIVETEAYIGPKDRASHALDGKVTKRNIAEFMIGGHIYIYLVYGMYWQFNISTGKKDAPECVLIRALEPSNENSKCKIRNPKQILRSKPQISKKIINLANGPGKLCHWMKLDKFFYAEDLTKSKRIWLDDRGVKIKKQDIISAPRIGIDYAGSIWRKKPWRFYLKNNFFVSKF